MRASDSLALARALDASAAAVVAAADAWVRECDDKPKGERDGGKATDLRKAVHTWREHQARAKAAGWG